MRYVRGAMKKKLGGGYKWHLSVHFSSHYLDSAYPSLLITSKGGGTSIHGLCIAVHPSLVAFLCTDRPTLIGLSTLLKQAKIASLYKRYMRIQGLLKTGPANQWRILGGGGGIQIHFSELCCWGCLSFPTRSWRNWGGGVRGRENRIIYKI